MTRPQSKPHARGWWATDAAERDAIGSNDGLDPGDVVFQLSDNTFHRCTSVDGGDASTWVDAGGATPTLSAVLGEGDVTDNQPIRGTNAVTAVLSALSLIAGTPTDPTEIGARALLQGGGASSGAVVGGIAEVAGGPPPSGQSQQGGLALVHGYDAAGASNQAGDTLVRGGDDAQSFFNVAGALVCRAGNTTGDRNGSPATFRGGDAGNFSGTVGGPARLIGADAGFNGIGGLAEVVSGGHLSGTGGNTGRVFIHSLDNPGGGSFVGTGDLDLATGNADASTSNKPGDMNVTLGLSGLGSGASAQYVLTGGGQRNNALPAGDVSAIGGEHFGTNRGGHLNLDGGPSASGARGDVLSNTRLGVTGADPDDAPAASDDAVFGTLSQTDTGITLLISTTGAGHFGVTDTSGTVRGSLDYSDQFTRWEFFLAGLAIYQASLVGFVPVNDLQRDLGIETNRWQFAFQGAPSYEVQPNLDNETFAVGAQGIIYVLSATGVVNIDLLASVTANTGKTWHIVVRSAANTINLRRNGGDTINGLGADITLVVGEYIVHNAGDGDISVHGPIAVAP